MPSYSVSASEIKYASGSSWTSGKARQGVYSSTRYEGALNFASLATFSFSNIAITGIQMRVRYCAAIYPRFPSGQETSYQSAVVFSSTTTCVPFLYFPRIRYFVPVPERSRSGSRRVETR